MTFQEEHDLAMAEKELAYYERLAKYYDDQRIEATRQEKELADQLKEAERLEKENADDEIIGWFREASDRLEDDGDLG